MFIDFIGLNFGVGGYRSSLWYTYVYPLDPYVCLGRSSRVVVKPHLIFVDTSLFLIKIATYHLITVW